jgi:hypothetical protein
MNSARPQFVCSAQTLQDKVLSPIIADLDRTGSVLEQEVRSLDEKVSILDKRIADIDGIGDISRIDEERTRTAISLDEKRLRGRQCGELRTALTKFRGTYAGFLSFQIRSNASFITEVLVKVKNDCDLGKSSGFVGNRTT